MTKICTFSRHQQPAGNKLRPLLLFIAFVLISTGQLMAQITATLATSPATCPNNGVITISNLAGGTPAYQVALTGGPGVVMPAPFMDLGPTGAFSFSGLQAGSFTVTVLDANGTEQMFTTTVAGNYQVSNYTPVPSLNACANNTQTGKITVDNITNGSPPFRYKFISPTETGFTPITGRSFVVDNLVPGQTYTLQVWDACENFQTREVQIPNIATPNVPDADIEYLDCAGNVRATFTASGDNGPFTFAVTSGPNQVGTSNTTGVFNFLPNSNYTVEVSNQCGGKTIKNISLGSAPTLQVNAYGATSTSCGSGTSSTGAFYVFVEGGILPYQSVRLLKCDGTSQMLSIQADGTYNQVVTNLTRPCMYTLVVTDACNTVGIKMFEMTAPGDPNTRLDIYDEFLCPADGSVNYRVRLGVSFGPPYAPSPPFSLSLTDANGAFVSGFPITTNEGYENIFALPPGVYTYRASDACGTFSNPATITVGTYTPPTLRLDATNRCINAGQVNLIGTNNNPRDPGTRQYKIISGPDRVGEQNNDGQFSNLVSGGEYTFEFYDGCKVALMTMTIPPYQQPTFEVGFGALCPPATVGTLQAVNLYAQTVGPYTYEIIAFGTTGGQTRPPQLDSTFTNLTVGMYNIRGADACKNSFTAAGMIGTLPMPVIQANRGPYCQGQPFRIRVRVPVFGATYTYFRDGQQILTTNRLVSQIPALPGKYAVLVTVPGGCTAISDMNFDVLLTGKLTVNSPVTACAGQTADLTAPAVTAGSDAGTFTYFQDANATVALDASTGPANAITKAGDYYIKLTSSGSCTVVEKVTVSFAPPFTVTLSSQTICAGQPATLTATGASTYDFGSGASATNTRTVTPTETTVYSVTGFNGQGCPTIPPVSATVTVKPTPSVASTQVNCVGLATYTVNFTATAGAVVTASQGVLVGNQVTGIRAGESLTLTATLNGCSANAIIISPDCQSQAASLGNFVFEDVNGNGQQDTGIDKPIAGVTVTLISNGVVIATTTTDAGGLYSFTGLTPGVPYSVSFTAPVGFTATTANTGSDATDSDAVGGVSQTVSLTVGENNATLDAGFFKPASLGDQTFVDTNGDGIQNNGEAPFPGVTVTLISNGVIVGTAVTDANGNYTFTGLMPGTPYSVSFTAPAGFTATTFPTGASPVVSLSSGENNTTIDAGFVRLVLPAAITVVTTTPVCDTATNVYTTTATVSLSNATASTLTLTDNGVNVGSQPITAGQTTATFTLTGISNAASHTVVATLTNGVITTANTTYNAPASCTVCTLSATVPPGNVCSTVTPVISGGTAPFNYNWSGPTMNVTVAAKNATHPNFANAFPAVYVIDGVQGKELTLIRGVRYSFNVNASTHPFLFTTSPVGGPANSGQVITAGVTNSGATSGIVTFTPSAGTPNLVYYNCGNHGNMGWKVNVIDQQPNGVLAGAMNGTYSLTVTDARSCSATPALATTVNCPCALSASVATPTACNTATNQYIVTGTVSATNGPATQLLTISVDNSSTVVTLSGNGPVSYTLTGLNSDGAAKTVMVMSDATACGMVSVNYTAPVACTVAPASLGNLVFEDVNANGQQDAGDKPIAGVTVTLRSNGNAVATTMTDANGLYSFTGLTPGIPYSVSFTAPAGFTATIANTGNDATDSDAVNGVSQIVSLTAGEDNLTLDAGFFRPASLGNQTFVDTNDDGIQNNGEAALGGVVVTLISNGNVLATATTDANGLYNFTGLTPGVPYSVSFTTPPTYTATTYPSGTSPTVTLSSGEANLTLDAGFNVLKPALNLTKAVDKSVAEQGEVVTYTLTLTNTGAGSSTAVSVQDVLDAGLVFVPGSASVSAGTFTPGVPTSTWQVPGLASGGSSTLRFQATLNKAGALVNKAQLPGLPAVQVCTSVPYRVCKGTDYAIAVEAPAGFSTYEWHRIFNGMDVVVSTTRNYTIVAPGEYRAVVDGGSNTTACPTGVCCPVLVREEEAPLFTATPQAPTCMGVTPQTNGTFSVSVAGGNEAGLTYQYSAGSSFNAGNASAPAGVGTLATGLVGGQSYTVRVVNALGCFRDQVITVPAAGCVCPPSVCAPFVVRKTRSNGVLIP